MNDERDYIKGIRRGREIERTTMKSNIIMGSLIGFIFGLVSGMLIATLIAVY